MDLTRINFFWSLVFGWVLISASFFILLISCRKKKIASAFGVIGVILQVMYFVTLQKTPGYMWIVVAGSVSCAAGVIMAVTLKRYFLTSLFLTVIGVKLQFQFFMVTQKMHELTFFLPDFYLFLALYAIYRINKSKHKEQKT